jgi:predicted nuclease of restriction endonuclease-like RecB superfamily
MLLSEHVLAQRRGDTLVLRKFDAAARARAETIAHALVETAKRHVGRPRGELEAALAAVDAEARDAKVKAGLTKLLLDRCTFEAAPPVPPEELRAELFSRAAAERKEHGHVDRDALVASVADGHALSPEALEHALYADLKTSHTLLAVEAIAPATLVELFARGQAQAVLLRAERVVARVTCKSPGALRAVFRALKFHRLLFTAIADGDTQVIGIDGPMSLFEASTKYGPRLAMALPALEACDRLELEAIVRWGKERTRLAFRYEHTTPSAPGEEPPLPDEVEALRDALARGDYGLKVKRSAAILTLPGVGTCVPDLELRDDRGRVAYVEVLGFWSRDAVWRRIELAERGLGARVLFCVSSRLRVSEEALPDNLPAALYVYKGAMSARTVAERAKALLGRGLRDSADRDNVD